MNSLPVRVVAVLGIVTLRNLRASPGCHRGHINLDQLHAAPLTVLIDLFPTRQGRSLRRPSISRRTSTNNPLAAVAI